MGLVLDNIPTEQIEKTAANIISILKEIKYNPTERTHEIVEQLEDYGFLEQEFRLDQIDTMQHASIELRYQAFCRSYLMMLFLKFIPNEHDAEIILMRYGYLQNFANPKMGERYREYWEHSHTYNKRIMGKDRNEKGNLFRGVEKVIIKELADTLARIMLNSNGKLGFAEDVLKEFSNNAIPEKLPLPITEFFTRTYIHKEKQIEEAGCQAEASDKNNYDRTVTPSDKDSEQRKTSELTKDSNADDLDTEPISLIGGEKPKDEGNDKIAKAIRFAGSLIAGSIIAFSIIIGIVKPIIIEKANAHKEVMSSVIPAENLSTIEDMPVVEGMSIEAESFEVKDIGEDKKIEVMPNITKKLTIELEPQDADISTLEFESSSPDIVNAEYGYITTYGDNMAAGKSYVIDITITAIKTDYKEVIHVTVESSETPNDVDGAVFGGSQK